MEDSKIPQPGTRNSEPRIRASRVPFQFFPGSRNKPQQGATPGPFRGNFKL